MSTREFQFPVVEATNTSDEDTSTSTHTVDLPADIVEGDLLIVAMSFNSFRSFTTPSGWTRLEDDENLQIYYKVASGSEGSTVSVTADGNCLGAHTSYRISHYQGVPEVGTRAEGSASEPNPPSLSFSWGASKTLVIAVASGRRLLNDTSCSAAPSGYSNLLTIEGSSGGTTTVIATAELESENSSEDPGTFNYTNESDITWWTQTIGIQGK